MSRRIPFGFIVLPLVAGTAFAVEPWLTSTLPGKPGKVLAMTADQPIMSRAIRRARAELPAFLELAAAPKPYQRHFSVRVALNERNESRYIWITGFSVDDQGLFAGVVDDDIHMESKFRRGDRFTFVRGDIADWTYTDSRSGRVYGAYTECALLTQAPADEAAAIREKFSLDCGF